MELRIDDPTCPAPAPVARRFLHDARDVPFVRLYAVLLATVVPTGILLFVRFSWWLAALHLALVLYFMGPYLLMHHNTAHRRLFKAPFTFLNTLGPWVVGPFFGESPETYFAHHVGMHHPENNLEGDVSSTLGYRRDSVTDFARYLLRFLLLGLPDMTSYFARKKRRSLMLRCALGELSLYAAVAALWLVDWRAALVVLVLPLLATRVGAMVANWAQHAFVDPAAPGNSYRSTITCINTGYNRRCFNDGYHIGHHLEPTLHWSEMPVALREDLATYEAEGALVFEGLDYFQIWACLMLRRYDWLERRVVRLGSDRRPPEEVRRLLQARATWTQTRARTLQEPGSRAHEALDRARGDAGAILVDHRVADARGATPQALRRDDLSNA